MKNKNKGGLTDEELAPLLEREINAAVGWDDKLSTERQKVWQYYDGKRPEKSRRGNSGYISTDVYDSVEAMHAQLLETFTGTQELVRFAPRGPKDVSVSDQITEAVQYVVHCKNPGHELFSDTIKSGLMARFGAAKVWWTEEEEVEELEVPEGTDLMQIATELTPDDDIEGLEQAEDGTVSGVVTRKKVYGYPKLAFVPSHEILVSSRARSAEEATLVAHRFRETIGQLKERGLSAKDLKDIKGTDDKPLLEADDEDYIFDPAEESSSALGDDSHKGRKQAWVYECYIRGDFDGSGNDNALWQITKVGSVILGREKIKRLPLVFFVALRRPGSFWGDNFAARVFTTQNAKTALMRAIIDHTAITTNPRLTVVRGTLQNPDELRDDRLGGVVNVNRPDGIAPLLQQPLNPFVFQALQTLDYDMEDTTGISRLSQGLNKDAVSEQNSAAMVEQLTSNSQTRQKIIARNFAQTFLVPLYELVAELIAEHSQDGSYEYLDSDGKPIQIPEGAFDVRRDLIVELHLGYGEAEREAEKWIGIDAMMSQNPGMQAFYTPMHRYQIWRKVLKLKGIRDTDTYMAPPEAAQPPPNPLAELEVKLKEQELQLAQAKMQLETMETQAKIMEMQAKHQLAVKTQADKVAIESAKLDLEERQFEHEVTVDNAEVEAMQLAAASDAATAVISPDGS
jgi:hypothetical protein